MCIAAWMHHHILLAVWGKSLGCWGSFCGCSKIFVVENIDINENILKREFLEILIKILIRKLFQMLHFFVRGGSQYSSPASVAVF